MCLVAVFNAYLKVITSISMERLCSWWHHTKRRNHNLVASFFVFQPQIYLVNGMDFQSNGTIFCSQIAQIKQILSLPKFLYLIDVYLFRKIIKNSVYYFRKKIRTLQLAKLQSWIKLLITSVMLLFVEKSQFW